MIYYLDYPVKPDNDTALNLISPSPIEAIGDARLLIVLGNMATLTFGKFETKISAKYKNSTIFELIIRCCHYQA